MPWGGLAQQDPYSEFGMPCIELHPFRWVFEPEGAKQYSAQLELSTLLFVALMTVLREVESCINWICST